MVYSTHRANWRFNQDLCKRSIPTSMIVCDIANNNIAPAQDTCIALPAWEIVVWRPGQAAYGRLCSFCHARKSNEFVGTEPGVSLVETGRPCKVSISFFVSHLRKEWLMISVEVAVKVIIAWWWQRRQWQSDSKMIGWSDDSMTIWRRQQK